NQLAPRRATGRRGRIAHIGQYGGLTAVVHSHPAAAGAQVATGDDGFLRMRPVRQWCGRPGVEFIAVARHQQTPAGMAVPGKGDKAHWRSVPACAAGGQPRLNGWPAPACFSPRIYVDEFYGNIKISDETGTCG